MTQESIVQFLAGLQNLDVQLSIGESFGESPNEPSTAQPLLRCSAPEKVLTPELKQQLIDRKSEIIAFLQQRSQPLSQSIPLSSAKTIFPLSFAQQRLWFLYQLAPDNPFYNVPAAIRFTGELNIALLERSFDEIVCRHAALRTTFGIVNGEAMQFVAPEAKISISAVDLRSIAPDDRERITYQLTTAEAQRSFNLNTDLPLRVTLLQFSDTDAILLLTLHHIVADGWSLGILIRELADFYAAGIAGQSATLPPLPVQYADFACQQRQWLQGDVLENQITYWRKQLQNISPLDLPIDRPRPAMQTYRGATYPLRFSAELTQGVEALSQRAGVSLYMILLAAFQTLLHRYTGQTDIAIGSPIANRQRSEVEGIIGFFVNSLVMRSDLSGNPTFSELLSQVRQVALDAYAHQDLPFEKLVEELDPERDLSSNPLFQIAFALQNAPMQPLQLPGIRLEPVPLEPQTTRFDLEVHLWEPSHGLTSLWQSETGLSGFISYSTDLFDRPTISRLVNHFEILLQGIVANPAARLSDLPLLTPAERQQLLVDWNQTEPEFSSDRPFHNLFEQQARQFPERTALVTESISLSYRKLNTEADHLAYQLKQIGVQPGDFVGLCIDRSADLLIGILAIFKANAVYVPIDPGYPGDRIAFILSDTGMKVLLTQSWLKEKLPRSPAQIICLDQPILREEPLDHQRQIRSFQSPPIVGDLGGNAAGNTKNNTGDHPAHSIAYVIYTSGSTGTPKGVLIPHRGLCNVVAAQRQLFDRPRPSRQVRVLQFSSLSFDASIFEIALAIGLGGTLYIPPRVAQLPGTALTQYLQNYAITHALLTPAVLAVLPAADLPALQTLVTGGEACPRAVIDRWAVDRRFFNAYGPTETTIWATVAQLHPGDEPLIGCPVANTQIYVLDESLQPVPIGVIGELYIGGAGVAQGYLNRPDLAARFIVSPFDANPLDANSLNSEAKLYRTGDRVRYRADGNLEFCGRSDDQIKIRGFRVEPGEIEAVLQRHPAIRQAIVLPAEKTAHDRRLMVCFSLSQDYINQAEAPAADSLQAQQIQNWQRLYNQTYESVQESIDPTFNPTFNITGWNSSYTGEPIPIEQMREWLDDRVQQILDLYPRRVLEIGCGTGLLLFQIAPSCQAYWGTDFSTASLETVQRQLDNQALSQVKLLPRAAIDFTDIPAAAFDVVILNSVVQYFPGAAYLLRVIEGAIAAVRPGGTLFLGDVRSLPLLDAFHAWAGLSGADGTVERVQLRSQVERSRFEESELAIDPIFFHVLRSAFPQIQRIQIRLTRGYSRNEMTQFRYSVLLQIGEKNALEQDVFEKTGQTALPAVQWTDWKSEKISVSDAKQYLLEHQPEVWGVKNIANDRVDSAVQTAAWLFGQASPKTVEQFRRVLQKSVSKAIDPQDWWDLEQVLPYRVEISWAIGSPSGDRSGDYDVLLIRRDVTAAIDFPIDLQLDSQINSQINSQTIQQKHSQQSSFWHHYTNHPLQSQLARQLIPELRSQLSQALPDYMIPAVFIPQGSLPLTPNGKIDRATLLESSASISPLPRSISQSNSSENLSRTAATPTELALLDIWQELLRLQFINPESSFFELGGHSLLATQMTSRIRDRLQVELPLHCVFETPTIAQLAPVIDQLRNHSLLQSPSIVRLDRSAYRRLRLKQSKNDAHSDKKADAKADTEVDIKVSAVSVLTSSNYIYLPIAASDSAGVQQDIQQESDRFAQLPSMDSSFSAAVKSTAVKSTAVKDWSPLVPLTLAGGRLVERRSVKERSPFFCVHPVFGVVFPYLELAQLMAEAGMQRSFYGLQPFGLDGKQLPFKRIEAMAAHYIAAVQTVQPHGPYLLGGWSFGGMVAFEMAQQLLQAGESVALLAILDTPAPLAKAPSPMQNLKFLLKTAVWSTLPFLLNYGAIVSDRLPALPAPLQNRWQSWYSRWQWSAITRLLPDARLRLQSESAIVPLLRIFYANSQAAYRYLPPPYAGEITLFKAAHSLNEADSDFTLGWSQLCDRVRVHSVPGNHLSMLKSPQVEHLAQQLQTYLD